MKRITTFFCLCFFVKVVFGQAQGTLTYQSDYSSEIATGKVITKIYESKSMCRIESNNTSTKSSLGPPKSEDQNVILMNFDNSTETHLSPVRKTAIITKFTVVMMEETMKKIGTEVSIQNLGQEKIGNYSCTHFSIVTTNPKQKAFNAKKDIWVTKDIGIGNVYFTGSYLYYPKGSVVAQKLVDAGAEGVVVKWQVFDPLSKSDHVCNLISYQAGAVPASMFAPPSDYQVIHNENFSPPSR
jgi:hypothetical protein